MGATSRILPTSLVSTANERFGTTSPQDDHAFESKVPDSEAVNLDPFSEDEVRQTLKSLGVNSALGPDGITVPMLVGWGGGRCQTDRQLLSLNGENTGPASVKPNNSDPQESGARERQ